MSATMASARPFACDASAALVVAGVRNHRSRGIGRYATLLAGALAEHAVDYRLVERAPRGTPTHFHLGNSSRAFVAQGSRRSPPLVVTVHDVAPRTRALIPVYRALVYPQLRRPGTAVIVHSHFAADMLVREAGRRPERLEVIPHPARRLPTTDRDAARRALGWPGDALIAVVPGVIKPVKLVRYVLAATSGSPQWRVALAGRIADPGAARVARSQGALVLSDPNDLDYEHAVAAADCVLCLRSDSVGETNGPLLDALGAGRAVLATPTGSIPEVAGEAISYCDGTERAVRAGLAALSDPGTRADLERAAARRSETLTWEASSLVHADLFREVFGA